jgi:aspartyl aminopeptidase
VVKSVAGTLAAFSALADLIDRSPSPAHAASVIAANLLESGSRELKADSRWELQPGSTYHLAINQRSVLAFRTPVQAPKQCRLAGAHTDSPCLHVREGSFQWNQDILVCGTDAYGSVIRSAWLDRPLRVAGSVVYRAGGGELASGLVEFAELKAVIPNLAIHLNREVNKGVEYNQNGHMRFYLTPRVPTEQRHLPWEWLCRESLRGQGVDIRQTQDILGMDLYLSDAQWAASLDPQATLVNSPRIDNLAGCQAVLDAFVSCRPQAEVLQFACFFDHEEIGSRSMQGADSGLLPQMLRRVWFNLQPGSSEEDFQVALARSGFASVDVAHAQHANWADMHDPGYAPKLNQGIVVKTSTTHRYATQHLGQGRFIELCARHGIACQHYAVRADLTAGSTIGPAVSSQSGIATFDIGIPILAMHSSRETAGMSDQCAMVRALSAFYEEY